MELHVAVFALGQLAGGDCLSRKQRDSSRELYSHSRSVEPRVSLTGKRLERPSAESILRHHPYRATSHCDNHTPAIAVANAAVYVRERWLFLSWSFVL